MRTSIRFPSLGENKKEGNEKTYKVFLINDIHIRSGVDGNPSAAGSISESDRYHYSAPNNLRNFIKLANKEKPDLVLCLGDMCDIPSDWELFNEIWSGLDDTIPRATTIGNHDLDVQTFPELLNILRYKGKQETAGSKFNQSFTLSHKDHKNKFIMLDTTFNANDEHGKHWQNVRVHTSSIDWFRNELLNSDADYNFVCTHVGPHLVEEGHFDSNQKTQLQNVVDNAISSNPKLKVAWFFGHHHLIDIKKYTNLGVNNIGYLLPALILNEEGRFTELKISNENFSLTKRNLPYSLS